jgi:hypothetical protein
MKVEVFVAVVYSQEGESVCERCDRSGNRCVCRCYEKGYGRGSEPQTAEVPSREDVGPGRGSDSAGESHDTSRVTVGSRVVRAAMAGSLLSHDICDGDEWTEDKWPGQAIESGTEKGAGE